MVSDSYFTHWAGALVNTNTSSVCLLPAGVIFLLIPELLEVLINIVLFLSLCLLGWLSFGLLGSSWVVIVMMIVMSLMVWVMKWVMDIVMISNGVLIMVIVMMVIMVEIVVFWVLTIDEMWLSVLGFISFMDGLWVDVMVIVVEESVFSVVEAMVVMVVISMVVVVCTIVSVYEWVVVDGFVVMVIVVVSVMISMVVSMPVSVVATIVMVIVVIVMVSLFMTVMVSVNSTIFLMVVVVDVVVSMSEAMSVSMISVSVVTPVGSPFTVVSMSISVVFMSETMISVKSPGFMVSSSPPVSMVWGLVVRSVEVSILMMAFVWKNVTNSDIISIVMGVSFSHVVSPVSLGVLHFLSVSTNVVVVMWVWEFMWEDLKWSLAVVLGIDNTDVSGIMVIIMVAEVIWVVLIMDVVMEVVSINMSFKSMSKIMVGIVTFMTILEMWLFVKSVLDMMTIISEASVFTMHVVAFVTETMSESVLSNEHWVGFGCLSELLGVFDLGAICSLVLMWGHLSVSFWENTLIRVSIVMIMSTGVVSLV